MPSEPVTERLTALLAAFAGKRVLTVGDLMLDEFIWGRVSRISPEAPVPVVNVTGESYYPGGAANVGRNLREFTSETGVIGLVGADANGSRLLRLLTDAGIATAGVQEDPRYATTVKTRIIARHQQVVRVDRESTQPITAEQTRQAMRFIEETIGQVDGLIAADYGKGFFTQELASFLCHTAHQHGKVLTVDPHPHTSLTWNGATAIKPNRAEAFLAAEMPPSEPAAHPAKDLALLAAAQCLQKRWQCGSLLITLGEQGMLLFHGDEVPYHTPTRARDVFDVSGAGDTAIAVFTLGLCAGATPAEAAELANQASSIVVGKLGTATASRDELMAALGTV